MKPAKTVREGYSRMQIVLHWAVVVLIAVQYINHGGVEDVFNARMSDPLVAVSTSAFMHVASGLGVLALAIMRLTVRLTRGAPPPPKDNPAIITWLGILNHLCLYLLMVAMPLTGIVAWFGFSEVSAELHERGRVILLTLIVLHVLGALFEHFFLRQDTLLRMFRPRS